MANSKTFNDRTPFSKAKYIKKKKERHLGVFKMLAPTAALLADTLHKQRNGGSLRSDALFNLILLANIH